MRYLESIPHTTLFENSTSIRVFENELSPSKFVPLARHRKKGGESKRTNWIFSAGCFLMHLTYYISVYFRTCSFHQDCVNTIHSEYHAFFWFLHDNLSLRHHIFFSSRILPNEKVRLFIQFSKTAWQHSFTWGFLGWILGQCNVESIKTTEVRFQQSISSTYWKSLVTNNTI